MTKNSHPASAETTNISPDHPASADLNFRLQGALQSTAKEEKHHE